MGKQPADPASGQAFGHDAFKLATEDLVAGAFLDHLESQGQGPLSARRPGDPDRGEPDVICTRDDGAEFGIEITAGHYSGESAKQLRAVVIDYARRGIRQTVMSTSAGAIGEDVLDLPPGVIRNPDGMLGVNLQSAMEATWLKRFGLPTYLILDASWAPITCADDAPAILARLARPDGRPFEDVYLCLVRRYGDGRIFFRVS